MFRRVSLAFFRNGASRFGPNGLRFIGSNCFPAERVATKAACGQFDFKSTITAFKTSSAGTSQHHQTFAFGAAAPVDESAVAAFCRLVIACEHRVVMPTLRAARIIARVCIGRTVACFAYWAIRRLRFATGKPLILKLLILH
jgi:hypothetical protein